MKKKILFILLGMLPAIAGAAGLSEAVTAVKSESATVVENGKELFDKAQKYFREKNYKQAKDTLNRLVDKHPMEDFIPKAKLLLADLQEDFEASITQFKGLASEYNNRPEGEEAQKGLGSRYYLADRYVEAAESYKKFIEKYPKSVYAAEARYWFASSLAALDKNGDAIQEFGKVLHDAPDSPWAPKALIGMGNTYFKMKKYNDAEKQYLKILDQYHYHDELNLVYFKLGQTYEMEKKPKEAHAAYQTLLDRFPKAQEVSEARARMAELEKEHPELPKAEFVEPPTPVVVVSAATPAEEAETKPGSLPDETAASPVLSSKPFQVQVGVYSKKSNVSKTKKAIRKAGYLCHVVTARREGVAYPIYKIRVGHFADRASAEKVAKILTKKTREKAIVIEE